MAPTPRCSLPLYNSPEHFLEAKQQQGVLTTGFSVISHPKRHKSKALKFTGKTGILKIYCQLKECEFFRWCWKYLLGMSNFLKVIEIQILSLWERVGFRSLWELLGRKIRFKWPAFYTSSLVVIGSSASELVNQNSSQTFLIQWTLQPLIFRNEVNSRVCWFEATSKSYKNVWACSE